MDRKKLGLTGAALGMLILILDSRAAARAAAEGVEVCIRTVIPSLFPFFLLSGYLTGGLGGGGYIAKLFHSPDSCGSILLTGLLGGYPVGARQAALQYRSGTISREQGNRLLWFCSQAGPSFLFGIVAAQLNDSRLAWMLWAVQIASALSVAWLLPGHTAEKRQNAPSRSAGLTEAMGGAISAIASVCGWVIFFSVVIDFLKRWVLWLLPQTAQILLCGLLELTNGCLLLGQVADSQLRFLLAAVMLNFGGLCVMMQTFSVTEGLERKGYIWGKLLQTLFSVLYALILAGRLWALLPILCAFSLRNLTAFRKRGSIPVKIGV